MLKLENFKIGQTIITNLGGEAKIIKIEGERIYFANGEFRQGIFCGSSGYCHYSIIKGIKNE